MKRIGRILSPEAMKENVQKLFLQTVNAHEPIVLEKLPIDACYRLLKSASPDAQDFWSYPRIPDLIIKNNASPGDLTAVFPNSDRKTIERDFARFRQKMLEWAETYHLNKEWIFLSICCGLVNHLNLQRQGQNSEIAFSDVVKMRYAAGPGYGEELISGCLIHDFWHSATESFDQYEKRIRHQLVKQRTEMRSRLSKYIQVTKPREFHQILWLVHWNIRGWSASRITGEDCKFNPEKSPMERNAFDGRKKYIYDEIQKLKIFDLPIRKRNPRS